MWEVHQQSQHIVSSPRETQNKTVKNKKKQKPKTQEKIISKKREMKIDIAEASTKERKGRNEKGQINPVQC